VRNVQRSRRSLFSGITLVISLVDLRNIAKNFKSTLRPRLEPKAR
jgi:hypothetical protein